MPELPIGTWPGGGRAVRPDLGIFSSLSKISQVSGAWLFLSPPVRVFPRLGSMLFSYI